MKKYALFILAGFLFFAGSNELQAKAVKLGRSTGSGTSSGYQFQPADNGGGNHGTTFCPANCASCSGNTCTLCRSDLLLKNGSCIACPDGQTCNGTETPSGCTSGYYSYNGSCKTCPAHNASCSGSSVTCQTGYYLTESGNGYSCTLCEAGYACTGGGSNTHTACETGTYSAAGASSCTSCKTLVANSSYVCCSSTGSIQGITCASGYRQGSNGNYCIGNCTGVNCASGYTPTATGTGCECVGNNGYYCSAFSDSSQYNMNFNCYTGWLGNASTKEEICQLMLANGISSWSELATADPAACVTGGSSSGSSGSNQGSNGSSSSSSSSSGSGSSSSSGSSCTQVSKYDGRNSKSVQSSQRLWSVLHKRFSMFQRYVRTMQQPLQLFVGSTGKFLPLSRPIPDIT